MGSGRALKKVFLRNEPNWAWGGGQNLRNEPNLESAEEVAEFEKRPNAREIVKVRYLDDAGKVAGMATPGFEHYAPMVQKVVDAHCAPVAA